MLPPRLHPRWLIGSLLVVAIVAGCLSAGFWQLRRLDQRRETNAQIRARSGAVIPLPDEGFSADATADDLVYRRVTATGTYDLEREVLVRFRSRRGLPGYEVVTPLRTDEGTLLVNRGWVPLEIGDAWRLPSSTAPRGEVTVEGLLAPSERGGPRIARAPSPDRPTVIGAVVPKALTPLVTPSGGSAPIYGLPLLSVAGPADEPYPAAVDPPDLGEGPHRDYAVQWFLFAGIGLVGWVTLLYRRGPLRRRQVAGLA